MTAMGADLPTLEARLVAVEKIQATNVPKFTSALRRLARLEKSVATTVISIAEMKLEAERQFKRSEANSNLLEQNSAKIETIYAFLTRTRSLWGWLRHHSPKAFAFAIGLAVSRGWITAENGHSFLSIFGL